MRLDVAQGQHRLPRYPTAPMTDALNWLRLGLSGMALGVSHCHGTRDRRACGAALAFGPVRWLVIAVVIYTSIHMLWQRPQSP
jgi:hypothetical protein